MRERKGERLANSLKVFYLLGSKDVYYVQSERSNELNIFRKYQPSVFEWCSCPDNSYRNIRCGHIWSIEYAIRRNILQEIKHLPENIQRIPQKITAQDWRSDQYDF